MELGLLMVTVVRGLVGCDALEPLPKVRERSPPLRVCGHGIQRRKAGCRSPYQSGSCSSKTWGGSSGNSGP